MLIARFHYIMYCFLSELLQESHKMTLQVRVEFGGYFRGQTRPEKHFFGTSGQIRRTFLRAKQVQSLSLYGSRTVVFFFSRLFLESKSFLLLLFVNFSRKTCSYGRQKQKQKAKDVCADTLLWFHKILLLSEKKKRSRSRWAQR